MKTNRSDVLRMNTVEKTKQTKHQWTENQAWGTGSGRPHGVDESWSCTVCGARKGRGPQSTHTGHRVIRWSYTDAHGYRVDSLPTCIE